MQEEGQLVAEKIEKGTYFQEALNWYNARYIFIQTQFSQLLIIAVISIIALILTFGAFIGFLPTVDKKLFVIYNDITPESFVKLKQLMNPGQDPDLALSRYYIEEYVKSREEYVVDRSERDFNFVYSLSGQDALENYLNAVSPDNPNSPFVIYANRGRRDILVTKTTFYTPDGKVAHKGISKGRAVVNFSAQENFGAAGQNVGYYIANVEFDYDKIQVNQETHQLTRKPEMVITNYTTKLADSKK